MKAAVLHGNNDIRYEEMAKPEVGVNQVRVRVMTAGICGSDVPRVLNDGAHYYPIVLGHEFSGYVDAVGEAVEGLCTGDKVVGVPLKPCMACSDCMKGNYSQCKHYSFVGSREQGAFADYVTLPAMNIVKIDDSVSYEQGALFEPSTVALHGVKLSKLRAGKTAAILGGGTIGLLTAQWARIFGAANVTVFDIDESRLDLARRLGTDNTINSYDKDYIAQAKGVTGGKGFDYVFETAGVNVTSRSALTLAANKGTVCLIGTPNADYTFGRDVWELILRKELTLKGAWMSCSAPFPGDEWTMTAHFFATGALKYEEDLFYAKYHMCDAQKAFDLYQTPGQVKGRVLLYNEDK